VKELFSHVHALPSDKNSQVCETFSWSIRQSFILINGFAGHWLIAFFSVNIFVNSIVASQKDNILLSFGVLKLGIQ
jgi:hypothetical protein